MENFWNDLLDQVSARRTRVDVAFAALHTKALRLAVSLDHRAERKPNAKREAERGQRCAGLRGRRVDHGGSGRTS